jgi:hypothetical protein
MGLVVLPVHLQFFYKRSVGKRAGRRDGDVEASAKVLLLVQKIHRATRKLSRILGWGYYG